VTPDSLYKVARALIAHAQDYETNPRYRHGRSYPEANKAAKYHRAALFAFGLSTMLRERNLAQMTTSQLAKKDGIWSFRFDKPGDLKGPRAFGDQVVYIWEGEAFQSELDWLLDKAAGVRPILVEHFRKLHPGKPDPVEFFLNENGKGFCEKAVQGLFYSETARYLGPENRIGPHAIRAIVPSWLFVREGATILPTVQRYLDHEWITTTEEYYLMVQRIFNARLAKAQMQERAKQRQMQNRMLSLPEENSRIVERRLTDFADAVSPESMLGAIQQAVEHALARHQGKMADDA
jgi:integrase